MGGRSGRGLGFGFPVPNDHLLLRGGESLLSLFCFPARAGVLSVCSSPQEGQRPSAAWALPFPSFPFL